VVGAAADDKARAAAQSVAAVGDVAAKEDISAVRAEIAAMRAEMAAMEVRLIRWMVGTISPLYALLAFVALRLPG